MKVLQVNYSDYLRGGGSAIAMYRLHLGLKNAGVDSKILCGNKSLDSDDSLQIKRNYRLESTLKSITSRLGLNDIHCLSSFKIKEEQIYQEADILNFHLIHSNFFNYLAIPRLTKEKPAVFTLHDMWSMTGHCAYSYDCDRWKIGCGKCPYPNIQPAIHRDNSHLEWKLKEWVYNHSNLTIVADSHWLAEKAKASILNKFSIYHIPYGLDTDIYQPLNSQFCRNLLGIAPEKKVLMFGAVDLKDLRKGGDLLIKVLQSLPKYLQNEVILMVLGESGEALVKSVDFPTMNFDYVSSDRLKAILYSAADLFLFPSRAEAFGIVAQEASSCGIPTVAFNVGGISDIVRHNINGYLAQAENIPDFTQGIIQLLEDDKLRKTMGQQGRVIALEEYSLELQAQRYIELYKLVLQQPLLAK